MPVVLLDGASHQREDGETVLAALLRGGFDVPHSCKAGACGSCMMRAVDGEISPNSQVGLKDAWKAQGYFLPCICVPHGDLAVAALDAAMAAQSSLISIDPLSADVVRLRLSRPDGFDFRAGQYLSLRNQDGLSRSYSVASLPQSGVIDLQIRVYPNGRMGNWIANHAKPGDAVTLTGPFGECFYVPGREQQPLLLIGTGTGLAPLQAIVHDALAHGHTGPVHLYHGAVTPAGLYLVDELRALANVNYYPVVLNGASPPRAAKFDEGPPPNPTRSPETLNRPAAPPNCSTEPRPLGSGPSSTDTSDLPSIANLQTGAIDAVALRDHPKLDGWRVFLCGDPTLVRALKKKVFLSGAAMRDIHADAFLPAAQ